MAGIHSERRKHVRMTSYLGGRVAFNHLYATADCLIRNISPEGCRLAFDATMALPARFVLSIPCREQALNARIVWRDDKEAGIAFETPEAVKPVSLDMARKIKKLEEDKKQLQRRIQELAGEA
jgi:hypothetical protein